MAGPLQPDGSEGLRPDDGGTGSKRVEVLAPLVASVVRVGVTPGERVAAGDTLLVVESMKMEIPVTAPTAGTVRTVDVAPADIVEEGDVLAVIDADG